MRYGEGGYGSYGTGNHNGSGNKPKQQPPQDNILLWVAGGIVALVLLVVYAQATPEGRDTIGFIRAYGGMIGAFVVVLGLLAWWGTTTSSIEESKLALNLFGIVIAIGFVVVLASIAMDKAKKDFNDTLKAFPAKQERR